MSNRNILDYKVVDNVASICLSRPEQYNSLNEELRHNFLEVLEQAEKDSSIRAVVIRGAGPGFCAGADLVETSGDDIPIQLEKEYKPIFEKIVNGKKIFIAAVHGSAAGIGSTLALACDFLVMSQKSRLSFVFSNIGLIPDGGAHWSLSQKLSYNKALEVIINGEHLSASDCEKLGLANKIFEENNFFSEVENWVQNLAKRSPLVSRESKQLLRFSQNNDYWATYNKEKETQARLAKTKDFKNAVKAFFNKEKPKFIGK
tara:strand:+ start:2648 stop:3424 length:777 start_codon:yes stop_codon:yes gene_type:complete